MAEFLAPALTPDMIPLLRQSNPLLPPPTDEELSRSGAFDVTERAVPGPDGGPDISLLVCRPAAVEDPAPVLYYSHGGGMIMGTNRLGILEILDWAEEFGLVVVSVEYRLAPETRHPGPIEDVRRAGMDSRACR